jgi:hypothetical protein
MTREADLFMVKIKVSLVCNEAIALSPVSAYGVFKNRSSISFHERDRSDNALVGRGLPTRSVHHPMQTHKLHLALEI